MTNAYFKSSNQIERQISNLAFSQFTFRGRECHSFEGFYQGTKRNGDDIQNHIFKMFGINAKKQGKPTTIIYFEGKKVKAGSKEHHDLLLEVQTAKYTQCEKSREALISTGNTKITHKVGGRDSVYYPAKIYCRQLTTIRKMLLKGELDHLIS